MKRRGGAEGREIVMCIYAQPNIHTQIQQMMQGHIDNLTDSNVLVVGYSLESAQELKEKHEAFITECKEVRMEGLRDEG